MSDPMPPSVPGGPAASGASPQPDSPPAAGGPPAPALISIEEFGRVKLVTAEVVEAAPHPKADKLLILQIRIGERRKQIVAGLKQFYAPEQLVGRTVIIVDNLQPAKLRGVESQGMLLAVRLPEGGVRLLVPDGPAPGGLEVS